MRPRLALLMAAALLVVALPAAGQLDDVEPPKVVGVTLDKETYLPGDVAVVRLEIDDESPLTHVATGLRDAASPLYLFSEGCTPPTATRPAVSECRVPIPAKAPGGPYVLHMLQARDDIGHDLNIYSGPEPWWRSHVTVDSPYTDRQAPLPVAPATGSPHIAAGTNHTFLLHADDASPLVRGGLVFEGPTPSTTVTADCLPAEGPGDLACPLAVPLSQPAGRYLLQFALAWDEVGYWGTLDLRTWPAEQRPALWVDSDVADVDPPVLRGLDFPDLPVPRGGDFKVRVLATDASGLETAVVRVRTAHGNAETDANPCVPAPVASQGLDCTGHIHPRFPLGQALLHFVAITDPHRTGQNYFSHYPWSLGCPTCGRVADTPENDTWFLVGPAPLKVLDGSTAVRALDVFFPDVAPGRVLPVVVQGDGSLSDVAFEFVDDATGDVLAIAGCAPDANQTLIGSLCHLIVPADAREATYRLRSVATRTADGAVHGIAIDPAAAPTFTVDADATSPAFALPPAWAGESSGGVTSAQFNALGARYAMPRLVPVTRETLAPADADPEDLAEAPPHLPAAPDAGPDAVPDPADPQAEDDATGALVDAPRESPVPLAAAVAGLALALARRRARPPSP